MIENVLIYFIMPAKVVVSEMILHCCDERQSLPN